MTSLYVYKAKLTKRHLSWGTLHGPLIIQHTGPRDLHWHESTHQLLHCWIEVLKKLLPSETIELKVHGINGLSSNGVEILHTSPIEVFQSATSSLTDVARGVPHKGVHTEVPWETSASKLMCALPFFNL